MGKRILSGAVLLVLVWVTFAFLPDSWAWVVILPLAMLGQGESLHILAGAGLPPYPRLSLALGGLLVAGHWILLLHSPGAALAFPGLVLALGVAAGGVMQMREGRGFALHRMAGTLVSLLYAPFLISFMSVLVLQPGGKGRWTLLFMILVVKSTDMGAYFTGRGLGKHLFAPAISPKKTWEGCVGGVLVGLLVALVFWRLAGPAGPGHLEFGLGVAVAFGLVLPMVGILGDLLESLMKRAGQVKDSGSSIQGLGGWLDVLDSLLLAAPVVATYTIFFN